MNTFTRPFHFANGMDSPPKTRYVATQQIGLESHMSSRPRRSALYMPGSNLRALDKARTLPVDVVIFDLEDAVAPEQKAEARRSVAAAISAGGYGAKELVIRVNGLETEWVAEDLAVAAACGVDAVLVPKISSPGDIMRAGREIRSAGIPEATRLWAMMETPLAVLNADAIARTAADPNSRLSVLVMGVNDLARETRARITPGRPAMLPWIATCIAAAHAHGAEILDGVYGDLDDANGLRAECEQGRDFGMDGKTLIHPSQIDICNEVFSPSADEIGSARRLVAAFEIPDNARKGVIRHEGRMVERLHLDLARRTLAIADRLKQQSI